MKLDVQDLGCRRISDVDGQGLGGLETSTTFMDAICISSLSLKVDIVTVKEKAPSEMMLHVEYSVFSL